MSELTIIELQEKIKSVEDDINHLVSTGYTGRKLEILNQYKDYLEEELSFLKKDTSSKT